MVLDSGIPEQRGHDAERDAIAEHRIGDQLGVGLHLVFPGRVVVGPADAVGAVMQGRMLMTAVIVSRLDLQASGTARASHACLFVFMAEEFVFGVASATGCLCVGRGRGQEE